MNYRKVYCIATGIEIPKNFDVHHIDFDRNHNYIYNLVALPKELHNKFHTIQNVSSQALPKILKGNMGSYLTMLDEYLHIYYECSKWIDYRDYLLKQIPNFHNLSYTL